MLRLAMGLEDAEEDSVESDYVGAAGDGERMADGEDQMQAGERGEGEDPAHDISSAALVRRKDGQGMKGLRKGGSRHRALRVRIPDDMSHIAPFLRRRRHGLEGTNSTRVVVQSGKRKGLLLYTDAAGKIVEKNDDVGYAIGRPSNAGVCHLKNKQVWPCVCE